MIFVAHNGDLPSSAKFPNATRHISVRAALWQWIPSNLTKVGITPILISCAWRESVKKKKKRKEKKGKSIHTSNELVRRNYKLFSVV
jgi:hypothetical protein